jgi:glycosyltransferase involved in cell wall biosynthesis
MNHPLVSICIPCYNTEKYITETLNSVLEQTYKNLEIIVCDNCSTDNTYEVLKSFNDPRIKIFQNESNIGFLANSKKVLSLASGCYIKWLCADDLLMPDCIEKQVEVFERNIDKNIVLVTARKWVINGEGKKLFTKGFPGKDLINGKKAIIKSVLNGGNTIGEPGCGLMKTDVFKKTEGIVLDEQFSYIVDIDLWNKILQYGDLYVIQEALFSFRATKTSISASKGKQQAKSVKDFFKQLQNEKIISKKQQYMGNFMATLMMYARILVYRFG